MAVPVRRSVWRLPVIVSVALHAAVLVALSLNLSVCAPEVKLPPVPAHVKAVVVDRTKPLPQLPPVELPPEPEPPQPEPEKPAPPQPEKKPEPPKSEPKKPLPKPAEKPVPKKPEVKKPAPKPEPPKPEKKPEPPKPPVPDFEAMMEREDRSLAAQDAARQAASDQAIREATAREAAEAKVLADYKQRILQELRRRWSRPPSARNGMSVTLSVNLIPGGEVVGTPAIVKSSGDAAFDRSAQNAVLLASPLPVPSDPAIFNTHFRRFTFVARPEDLKQ
ncbi:MAG: cell envelope integrity protein TolA [Pseudomonadota bacterium]